MGSVMSKIVLGKLKKLGYEVVYGLLNAADYGSPQIRHRLFIFGSLNREFGSAAFRKQVGRPMSALDLVPPTHHRFAPYEPIAPWRNLRDAIGHLAQVATPPSLTYGYSPERAAIFSMVPAGQNWTYVRDNPDKFRPGFLRYIMKGAIKSGGGKTGYWRRLSWDLPAPTLTGQPQQLATSLCHPDQDRPLSIPEYAAIQDFPPDYQFNGTKSSVYQQIGNAVPANLAKAVGAALLAVARRTDQ